MTASASPAANPSHDSKQVDVLGHRLEVVDLPAQRAGTPPLVFLHEGLGSVAMWRDFPARVAQVTGARVVVYSRVGMGRSSPRQGPFTPRFMHEEAQDVLPALRAELGLGPPVLVGHSNGASMSLIHAGHFETAGVIAMAPFVNVEEANLQTIRGARELWRNTDLRAKLARYHDDVDSVFRSWSDIWLSPGFRSWSIEADLAGIRCPVVAILGDGDRYSTPAQVATIECHATHAASFEFLHLAGCGHSPHRDQPRAVIDAIVRLLSRLPG
ncbi:MAG: alpha/beta hydrolase [Proteobacteria bacterium]|nr:alpha/beta hydrolase [Pseudomonadota bacterium]